MTTVDVNADTLRTGGETLTEERNNLASEGNVHLLHGVGDDRHLSTGGFFPGVMAQDYLRERYNEVQPLFSDLLMDLLGLSSGLHVVADLYNEADHLQAVEFAFANPEAQVPGNLPWYINAEHTLGSADEWAEEAREDGVPPPTQGEAGEGSGSTERQRYIPSGPHGPGRWVTETLDADGNVLRAEYRVVYPSGASYYYTEVPGENGMVQSDHVYVGPQNSPVGEGEVLDWILNDSTEEADEQLERLGLSREEAEERRNSGGN